MVFAVTTEVHAKNASFVGFIQINRQNNVTEIDK